MLTQIDVESENAFFVPVLGVTPKDSLLIKQVKGLNPPSVSLYIGDYSRDGGVYQGRGAQKRNVVITMDLNPNPALGQTVSGLRDMLYKAFMDPLPDADYVKLVLHDDDNRERYVVGYAEKFETEIFASDSMVQISLICPDPYIRDNEETVLTHPTGWVTVPFTYGGTAETGFKTKIYITGNTNTLTLENNGRTMVLERLFLVDDVITINTIRGERNITLTRGGVDYPALAALTSASRFLELHSQSNTLKVYGLDPSNIIAGVRELKFTASYWGI